MGALLIAIAIGMAVSQGSYGLATGMFVFSLLMTVNNANKN